MQSLYLCGFAVVVHKRVFLLGRKVRRDYRELLEHRVFRAHRDRSDLPGRLDLPEQLAPLE